MTARARLFAYHFAFGLALLAAVALASSNASALGSTPVTVVNPADIAKAENIQHPFAQLSSCLNSGLIFCPLTFNVPASQRWAIESVSYQCSLTGTNLVLMEIDTHRADNTILASYFPTLDHGFAVGGGILNAQGAQNLRFYADPGTSVSVIFQMSSNGDTGCQATITGQAIDVP